MAEGSTVAVKVTLSADPERSVTIPARARPLRGGATGDDYFRRSGERGVRGAEESGEVVHTFRATEDTVDDDGESVKLAFGTLPEGVSRRGPPAAATVSITDDDDPAVTVSFAGVGLHGGRRLDGRGEGDAECGSRAQRHDPTRAHRSGWGHGR